MEVEDGALVCISTVNNVTVPPDDIEDVGDNNVINCGELNVGQPSPTAGTLDCYGSTPATVNL